MLCSLSKPAVVGAVLLAGQLIKGCSSTSERLLDISITVDEDWSLPSSPRRIEWEVPLARLLPRETEVELTKDLYARSLDGAESEWQESNRYLQRETNDLDKGDPSDVTAISSDDTTLRTRTGPPANPGKADPENNLPNQVKTTVPGEVKSILSESGVLPPKATSWPAGHYNYSISSQITVTTDGQTTTTLVPGPHILTLTLDSNLGNPLGPGSPPTTTVEAMPTRNVPDTPDVPVTSILAVMPSLDITTVWETSTRVAGLGLSMNSTGPSAPVASTPLGTGHLTPASKTGAAPSIYTGAAGKTVGVELGSFLVLVVASMALWMI